MYYHSDGVGSSVFSSSVCPRSSIFQELYVPEVLYSMSSMFPELYVPGPLHVPAVLCSRNSMFPELHTQGAPYSKNSTFPEIHVCVCVLCAMTLEIIHI